MKNIVRIWIVLLFSVLVTSASFKGVSQAAIINAISTSYDAVDAAVAKAQPGDTIIVPSGVSFWSQTLVITKGLVIKGAGADKTVISATAPFPTYTDGLILYQPNESARLNNDPFRLTGFTFDGNDLANCVVIKNYTTDIIDKIRVDHNEFKRPGGNNGRRGIQLSGTVYGVIDNNVFHFENTARNPISSHGLNDQAWSHLTRNFGNANNIYYEDNIIHGNFLFDCGHGGRWAARYNLLTDVNRNLVPAADWHGNQAKGLYSTMVGEMYGNLIEAGNNGGDMTSQRGGQALVFFNMFKSSLPSLSVNSMVWEEFPDDFDGWSSLKGAPYNNGIQHTHNSYYWNSRLIYGANGQFNKPMLAHVPVFADGVISAVGPSSLTDLSKTFKSSTFEPLGQPSSGLFYNHGRYSVIVYEGVAKGTVRNLSGADNVSTLYLANPWTNPKPAPGDRYRIVIDHASETGSPDTLVVRENSEFFNYDPQSTFNGQFNVNTLDLSPAREAGYQSWKNEVGPGMGCGTTIPTMNCSMGAGYWVSQEGCPDDLSAHVGPHPAKPISGTLFKCTAANTWTAFYKPFAYPHPLRTDCANFPSLCGPETPTPQEPGENPVPDDPGPEDLSPEPPSSQTDVSIEDLVFNPRKEVCSLGRLIGATEGPVEIINRYGILVKRFSEMTESTHWDGRNEKGDIVAVGVYRVKYPKGSRKVVVVK